MFTTPVVTFVLCISLLWDVNAQLGIPGTPNTLSGYDTEGGTDPICWFSDGEATSTPVSPNPLVQNFSFHESVRLLESCPPQMGITVDMPAEFLPNRALITKVWYNYTLKVSVNVDELRGDYIFSDKGSYVVTQVIVCVVGKGFCSPFVHEQANVRQAAIGDTTKTKRGDLHGGSHVHSKFAIEAVPPTGNFSFTVQVPLVVNEPNDFFIIGSMQMYTSSSKVAEHRYDIANAASHRLVSYRDPPTELNVTDNVRTSLLTLIAFGCAILVAILEEIIRNRDNRVLILAQKNFLIVEVALTLLSTASAVMLEPKNDIFCKWGTALVLLPMHIHFSIAVGRLWRINRVISPLLKTHYQQESIFCFKTNPLLLCKPKEGNIREVVTAMELVRLIFLLSLPQVLIQLLSVTLQPRVIVLNVNEAKTVGVPVCTSGASVWKELTFYGYAVFFILNLILLGVAYSSRKLPSLFNETHDIFVSVVMNISLIMMAILIFQLTKSPENGADVKFVVWILLVVFINLNATVRLMLPKLRMVWRKEKILVSSLVSDHKEKERAKRLRMGSSTRSRWGELLTNVTGFRPSKKKILEQQEVGQTVDSGALGGGDAFLEDVPPPPAMNRNDTLDSLAYCQSTGPKLTMRTIEINDNRTPSRLVIIPLVELKSKLNDVTNRITSGLAVSHEDWEAVRSMTNQVALQFSEQVKFSWEQEKSNHRRDTMNMLSNFISTRGRLDSFNEEISMCYQATDRRLSGGNS